ncbi:hypothetical protein GCM10023147_38310 [Tsukamurella soli]|uniref:Hemophore-related protein, Rv0203/Rv1174c family n=1 Tax=Tsukamurella soli TaxID=644556 RepID=A0ABP8K3J5_9ACTN
MRAFHLAGRVAAAATDLGVAALIAAPLASAPPPPAPGPLSKPKVAGQVDWARKVPGTSCTLGQVRGAMNHLSPGLYQRLQDAAGGPQTFSDIVSADPASRSAQLVGLVLRGSATSLQMVGQEADIENTVRTAYQTCNQYPTAAPR